MHKITRYWVALDSKGRPILGSLIARPKRPVKGEWLEIAGTPCCHVSAAFCAELIADTASSVTITLSCGSNPLAEYTFDTGDPDTVVNDFNDNYPAAGTLSHDGENFLLTSTLCPSLSMEISCS